MKKQGFIQLETAEKETIARILLSTILAFLMAWAMGRPYSPTIAVTANLCLYTDRGYRGGIRYGTRRVLVQAVQGILVLLVMVFVRHVVHLPLPDALLILLASCTALLMGLPVNYRHPYSPLVCTLGNATFIIACAAIRDLSAFPYRVLECLTGFLIGYMVNHLIFPRKNRYQETIRYAASCTRCLLLGTETLPPDYPGRKKMLQTNLAFLLEDTRSCKNSSVSAKALEMTGLLVHLLDDVENYMSRRYRYQEIIPTERMAVIEEAFRQGSRQHQELTDHLENHQTMEPVLLELPDCHGESVAETVVLGSLLVYLMDLNRLAKLSLDLDVSVCRKMRL